MHGQREDFQRRPLTLRQIAIFVAEKAPMTDDDSFLFIQARYGMPNSTPEREVEALEPHSELVFSEQADDLAVQHMFKGCLRLHKAPIRLL